MESQVKSSNHSIITASYSYKRDKFGAVVNINYDRDSYDIIHSSSHNLNFTEKSKPENDSRAKKIWNGSQKMFHEYNPFDSSNNQGSAQQSTSIHKVYNKWVTALDKNIGYELDNLGGKRVTALSAASRTNSKGAVATKKIINCR